jgi:hypothetical protein
MPHQAGNSDSDDIRTRAGMRARLHRFRPTLLQRTPRAAGSAENGGATPDTLATGAGRLEPNRQILQTLPPAA